MYSVYLIIKWMLQEEKEPTQGPMVSTYLSQDSSQGFVQHQLPLGRKGDE